MMFFLVAVLAVAAALVIANVRLAGRRQSARLGWMSEAWLIRHRSSDFR